MTDRMNRRTLLAMGAAVAGLGFSQGAQAQAVAYSWTSVPFGGGGFIDGFAYHPKEKGLLYTRTDVGGAYRFDRAARRWLPLLDHIGRDESDLMGVLSLALDPNDPERLYLACGEYLGEWAHDGAVLCSADRGATWSQTKIGVKLGGNSAGRGTGERLQVDPNLGDILFLGTNQNGLMKSMDRGRSFTAMPAPVKAVTLALFDGRSGKKGAATPVIYVGSADDKGALLKSSDGGASFAPVDGLPRLIPQRAAIDEAGNLYVTFSSGLTPFGAETGALWRVDGATGKARDISPAKPGGGIGFAYCGLDIDRNRPGTVIVSTMNRWATHDDIYISRDGGGQWKAIGPQARHDASRYPWLVNYLKGEDRMGHWIADVKIDPFNSDEMIYCTGYGLWLTQDLGHIDGPNDGKSDVHFDFAVDRLEETVTMQLVSPSGGATLFAAMGDVSGAAWDDLGQGPRNGLFAPSYETNWSVAYAALNPVFVARTVNQARTSGYYSEDGGASWTPFGSSPRTEKDAKGGYNNAGIIAVSAKGTAMVWAPEKQGAFYSLDKGRTWKESAGWPAQRDAQLAAVADPMLDGVFYVHDRTGQQVLISTDSGASFRPVAKGLPKVEGWQSAHMVATPGRVRDLWLALPDGLYHSPEEKTAFKPVTGVDEAWLVSLGKAAKDYPAIYLYGRVKGQEGLWRSDDGGIHWVRINDDAHRYGRILVMAADPLEYGTVYIGPPGRGVIVGRPA